MTSVFPRTPLPPMTSYATPIAGGNQILQLYQAQPPGLPYPWYFAHRANAKAAGHAFTIYRDDLGQENVHLLITQRPSLGGKQTIELPAGLWGDVNDQESALASVNREIVAETGMKPEHTRLLANQLFATSPGMTTEMKYFAITRAQGVPSGHQREDDEKLIIVKTLDVPLATFTDYRKFMAWLQQMHAQDYVVGMDVLAARGLLPPKLDRFA